MDNQTYSCAQLNSKFLRRRLNGFQPMIPKISVFIITKNEAHNIARAIRSCRQFDEILILDAESDDGTCTIAGALGAKCKIQPWLGFGHQKQKAAENCSNDWVLSLDADEELTPALLNQIINLDLNDPQQVFSFKRVSYFLGKPVHFSGWQNDYLVRLFNRKNSHFSSRIVHERVVGYKRKTRIYEGEIKHYSYQSATDVEKKIQLYSELGATEIFKTRKKRLNVWMILLKTAFAFIRTFFIRLGLFDGLIGFQIALMNSRVTFRKYQKFNLLLKEEQNS